MKKCGILMVTLVMMFLVLLPQIALADEIVWEDNTKTGRETEGSEGSDFEGIDTPCEKLNPKGVDIVSSPSAFLSLIIAHLTI